MKKIPVIFLCFIVILGFRTQEARNAQAEMNPYPRDSAPFQFAKRIAIDPAAGSRFRYEMAVSGDPAIDFSGLKFYGVAANGKKQLQSSRYQTVEKRTEQEWTIFTIEGTLPEGADAIWFYTAVTTPGVWYFDDISLYQERSPGTWKQLNIFNHSFEQQFTGSIAGFAVDKPVTGNPKITITDNMAKTGRHSLMITYSETKQSRGFAALKE